MLGWGMLEGSQALWMSSLQESRVAVRLASCLAPSLVVLPPQDGADLLPPPASTNIWAMEPNRDFLPDLFPAVVFCFSILFFCFSKLEMTSFHIFMIVIDCSKQAEEIVVCLELLFLFILFFLLLDPFFPFPFLCFRLFLCLLLASGSASPTSRREEISSS